MLKWLQPLQKTAPWRPEPVSPIQAFAARPQLRETGARETGSREAAASPWRVGQNVIHAKFGAGVIVNCEGRGADARVEVKFGRNGSKWLLLEYAKLTAL